MLKANNRLLAETIGLKALGFLAAIPDDFQRFLNLSGLDAATIGERVGEPEFLAAVLEFLLGHEDLLTGFCGGEDVDPRQVHLAHRALGGAVAD